MADIEKVSRQRALSQLAKIVFCWSQLYYPFLKGTNMGENVAEKGWAEVLGNEFKLKCC